MTHVILGKRSFQVPTEFRELSWKQVAQLAPLRLIGPGVMATRVDAFRILSGMGFFSFKLMPADELRRLVPLADWIFTQPLITDQLIPKFRGRIGPASNFDNLRMKEFHVCEVIYKQLTSPDAEEVEDHLLDRFVAVLYRPARWFYDRKRDSKGDRRRPFNPHEIDYHAGRVRRWPLCVKQAIFLWYDTCREELIRCNPWVFSRPSTSSYESEFDTGLYGMMRSLAGEKLGSIQEIEEMYVHSALLELGLIREEEHHIEQELKKSTRQS